MSIFQGIFAGDRALQTLWGLEGKDWLLVIGDRKHLTNSRDLKFYFDSQNNVHSFLLYLLRHVPYAP